jgi:hypothetical protein
MSHTPGPWHIETEQGWHRIYANHHIPQIALCPIGPVANNGDDIDNAQLIAAAPDLLEALQAIMKHPHVRAYLPYDPTDPVFLGAVEAIKKATGG